MKNAEYIPYRSGLEKYQHQAEVLIEGLKSGDESAAWRFKWLHPRYRGKVVNDVRSATLDLADAQLVLAHEYGFENWAALERFVNDVSQEGPVDRFEAAVEAVVAGDLVTLRTMLRDDPELIRARSTRRHHSPLLHYVAANGVEQARQRTPANAVEVANLLLEAGAEADALADMYEAKCTTMSMLVSSSHPAEAGLQVALAETLLDHGAAIVGPGSKWQSAIMTALQFGYSNTAQALARRFPPSGDLATMAGLGRLEDVVRLLPDADAKSKHVALPLASQHSHVEIVRLLLDAGVDPSQYNPDGFHSHSTPLHQAVWANHANVVRLLVQRGARLNIPDTVYSGTPLDWATHGRRTEIADYLRSRGATKT